MAGGRAYRFFGSLRKDKRGCGSINLKGVSEIGLLGSMAADYAIPDVGSFAEDMMRAVDELSAAGALDSGNGEVLDARIDMELERACARLSRQHAENAVVLDRIEAALEARLKEREVREADIAERLDDARAAAEKARRAIGDAEDSTRGVFGDDGCARTAHALVRIAPRIEDVRSRDMKEVGNA